MSALLGRPAVRIGVFLAALLLVLFAAYGLGVAAGTWLEVA